MLLEGKGCPEQGAAPLCHPIIVTPVCPGGPLPLKRLTLREAKRFVVAEGAETKKEGTQMCVMPEPRGQGRAGRLLGGGGIRSDVRDSKLHYL